MLSLIFVFMVGCMLSLSINSIMAMDQQKPENESVTEEQIIEVLYKDGIFKPTVWSTIKEAKLTNTKTAAVVLLLVATIYALTQATFFVIDKYRFGYLIENFVRQKLGDKSKFADFTHWIADWITYLNFFNRDQKTIKKILVTIVAIYLLISAGVLFFPAIFDFSKRYEEATTQWSRSYTTVKNLSESQKKLDDLNIMPDDNGSPYLL